jgi:hypothetical protein
MNIETDEFRKKSMTLYVKRHKFLMLAVRLLIDISKAKNFLEDCIALLLSKNVMDDGG